MIPEDVYYHTGADLAASGRFSLQHLLYKSMFGWLLYPAISAGWKAEKPPTRKRIADVACGNGIWGVEMAISGIADDLEVICLEAHDNFFPAKQEWPDNVKFEVWDVNEPPPKHYERYFDVVNIRLVIAAVRDSNPRPIVQNVLKLLKPGGYIQWCDIDYSKPILPDDSAYRVMFDLFESYGGLHGTKWVLDLDEVLKECGRFDRMKKLCALPKKEMHPYWADNWAMAIEEIVRRIDKPEIDEAWRRCEEERAGKGFVGSWWSVLVIGRKSLGGFFS